MIDLNLQINFSDSEFDLISRTVSALLPIKLAVEVLCRRKSDLLAANATINFMLQTLKEQHTSLSEELYTPLKNRTKERHIKIENVLRYLRNYNEFKNENKKRRKERLTKSIVIKFIENFLKTFNSQTYPHSKEFLTVIYNDDDTNKDSEKKLSLKQKLELMLPKKNSPN
ncbi:uncharacterized protein TNCV_1946991 [Trichonephila clavipes]|nr:uncharacterized protein TNCV_1946991 [Trichonephila clavipes]